VALHWRLPANLHQGDRVLLVVVVVVVGGGTGALCWTVVSLVVVMLLPSEQPAASTATPDSRAKARRERDKGAVRVFRFCMGVFLGFTS
jgi:sensor domain CHASE-containing protein